VLAAGAAQSETNAAVVLDAPVNYDSDAFHFTATPNIRYGDASGYSGVTSNFFHLDSSAQLNDELGSTSVTAAIYRDSSLLYAGELVNGVGVRRDSSAFGINWQHLLSERLQVQLAGNTSRALYAENDAATPPPTTAKSWARWSIIATPPSLRPWLTPRASSIPSA